MMKLVLCLLTLCLSEFALSELKVQPGDGNKVEVEVDATILNFTIEGGKVSGALEEKDGKLHGDIEVGLVGLATGLDLRDEHLHQKYLLTKENPKAKLVLKPWSPTASMSDFSGDLVIKGKSLPLAGKAKKEGDKVYAEAKINIEKYGFKDVSWKDAALGDTVDLKVWFSLK